MASAPAGVSEKSQPLRPTTKGRIAFSEAYANVRIILRVECENTFLLEFYPYSKDFQFSDSVKGVYGVSREAAHRLGDNSIHLSGAAVIHHCLKSFPVIGGGAAYTTIRINAGVDPAWGRCDQLLVIILLRLEGITLTLLFR